MTLRDDLALILGQSRRVLLLVILLVLPGIYVLSGFYSVDAEERGIVTRFGRIVHEQVLPGIHYHLPWPIEQVETLSATALRTLEIDFSAQASTLLQPEITTGDENLVDLAILVQYNIQQPDLYLSSARETETLLQQIAYAETIFYVGSRPIDQLLTTGRTQFQNRLKSAIQASVSNWHLGLRITSVQIRRLEPPASIKKAFDNVARARSEKQKMVQESAGERSARMAEARSEARDITEAANAHATEVLETARGDRDRFLATWEAYRQAPALTGQRLYLEKLESIFDDTAVLLVDPDSQ